jgi:hypothetical protein
MKQLLVLTLRIKIGCDAAPEVGIDRQFSAIGFH